MQKKSKGQINNFLHLFPKRQNIETQVDVEEARGNDVIKRVCSHYVVFVYAKDNNNKDTNKQFCDIITPKSLFMWVFSKQ